MILALTPGQVVACAIIGILYAIPFAGLVYALVETVRQNKSARGKGTGARH